LQLAHEDESDFIDRIDRRELVPFGFEDTLLQQCLILDVAQPNLDVLGRVDNQLLELLKVLNIIAHSVLVHLNGKCLDRPNRGNHFSRHDPLLALAIFELLVHAMVQFLYGDFYEH
jgi:hypothetical protein